MKVKCCIFLLILNILFANLKSENKLNIGLLIMATGKYISFVKPLIDSAKKYFCTNHNVNFFVFTDNQTFEYQNSKNIFQSKLGWPYDTLMRFDTYWQNQKAFAQMDYLFACDADMLFVDTVGDEILGDIVGTIHPGFFKRKIEFPYERNKISTAYVEKNKGENYFAGGFFGGKKEEFVKLVTCMSKNIYIDLENYGYVAKFHDESQLNRYFIDNKPTKILTPSYCYPEDALKLSHDDYKSVIELPKKLIALAKKESKDLHSYKL